MHDELFVIFKLYINDATDCGFVVNDCVCSPNKFNRLVQWDGMLGEIDEVT